MRLTPVRHEPVAHARLRDDVARRAVRPYGRAYNAAGHASVAATKLGWGQGARDSGNLGRRASTRQL
jgi:hypothetical protein